MQKQISLSGSWGFALDADCRGEADRFFDTRLPDTISLPGTTAQAQKGERSQTRETGFLTELYPFCGWAWYQTTVTLAAEDAGKLLRLTLGRTRLTTLWVNGKKIGSCDSLNAPHVYDLPPVDGAATLQLTVRVSNRDYPTGGGHLTSPDTQTNWNGITGALTLEVLAPVHLTQVQTYPLLAENAVNVRARLIGATAAVLEVSAASVSMDSAGAHAVPAQKIPVTADADGSISFTLPLGADALHWSEFTPVFYRLQISVAGTDEVCTCVTGLRELRAVGLEFQINGAPTFLRGKHDGLIFPLTGAAPTDLPAWVRVFSIAKRYGINHYRFHTCCPPEAAFTAADLLGIYLQPELPFWGTLAAPDEEQYNEAEQAYLVQEGFRMLDAFGNHPSFCLLSLGNELWGNPERMAEILRLYHAHDNRHLYTQGSNNFQFWPVILPEDDFFSGVRMDKARLFRGSYAMCDAPLGHVQTDAPTTRHSYEQAILPTAAEKTEGGTREIEIQYGTGVKKVTVSNAGGGLLPTKPVVSHEIGQYAVYPNFHEIEKYTGVLRACNFEIFRERLAEKGMLDLADDFFRCSGKLSAACYKAEIEAALRTEHLAGFQLLDLQDFSGQGTALVGMLDAFLDSKGLIPEADWRGFCDDAVLLAQFDSFVLTAGSVFAADVALRCYRPRLSGEVHWQLTDGDALLGEGTLPLPQNPVRLVQLGQISVPLPQTDTVRKLTLHLCIPNSSISNHYPLELMPAVSTVDSPRNAAVVHSLREALPLLQNGQRVVLFPQTVHKKIEGTYCTDFWCYHMFRQISENMGRPEPVGTMGLCMDTAHPAVCGFATENFTTPAWYQLVSHADCAILDDAPAGFRPIVQMIDNFERNHKLGILFEARVGTGCLLVCTARVDEIPSCPEVQAFLTQLFRYADSPAFLPQQTLPAELLEALFA